MGQQTQTLRPSYRSNRSLACACCSTTKMPSGASEGAEPDQRLDTDSGTEFTGVELRGKKLVLIKVGQKRQIKGWTQLLSQKVPMVLSVMTYEELQRLNGARTVHISHGFEAQLLESTSGKT